MAVPFARAKFRVEFSSINPDDVKELLPDYEGWNAEALHEESSDIAESDIELQATKRRHNFIYDIVGKNRQKVEKAIVDFDSYGYRVFVILTDLPPWKAAVRAWERFQENPFRVNRSKPAGRFVPPDYVYLEVGRNPIKTFNQVKGHNLVTGYCRLNVDVARNQRPKIMERRRM